MDLLVLSGLLAHTLFAAAASLAGPPSVPPPAAAAKRVPDFSLTDTKGAKHSLAEWRRGKAVLLFFIGTECPVSNGYAPQMQQFAAKYAALGVACYGVHCEKTLTAAEANKHAAEYGLTFTLLLDPSQILAQATGARVTPEAVVVSSEGKVLYRGRIDDRYASDGKRRDEPTVLDLENALSSVLAGAAPKNQQTKAFGCPLPRPKQPVR
ncbi:MAG: redoxin domain-containing protein [Planctomycetia bacterium]|nr:redoxin domain-containing protein [Planctomycetia bacterium]